MAKQLPKYLKKEEIRKIIDLAKPRDKLIIQFMYQTGVRVSELINLRIEDLDFDNRSVYIFRGKGAKDRTIFVSEDLIQMLSLYNKGRKKGPLFLSNWNKPFTSRGLQKKIQTLAKNANIPYWYKVTPHTLRHTCAVHALSSGVNIQTIRKHLGHSHLQTTQIYTEISDELVRLDLAKHNPFDLSQDKKKQQLIKTYNQ